VVLIVSSLLSILLATMHLTDDIVRVVSPSGLWLLWGLLVVLIWLYATVALVGRPSGYIIILLGSLLATAMPILHMAGKGIVTAGSPLFVWTDLALDLTAPLAVILAAQGLWSSLRAGKPQ
jgi:hypothetical protein